MPRTLTHTRVQNGARAAAAAAEGGGRERGRGTTICVHALTCALWACIGHAPIYVWLADCLVAASGGEKRVVFKCEGGGGHS